VYYASSGEGEVGGDILKKVLEALGFSTPFLYAAATYGFFHWLDKKASGAAKKAISGWLEPKQYDRTGIAAATLEMFNRIYTAKLLSCRAFGRSTLFTFCVFVIFLYESYLPSDTLHIISLILHSGAFYSMGITTLFISLSTNIISDYFSLFVVKPFLISARDRSILDLLKGPIAGITLILFAFSVRAIILTFNVIIIDEHVSFADAMDIFVDIFLATFIHREWQAILLAALVVHLWLPLLVLCVGILKTINYLRLAIGWTQWFIKQGHQHPLDAVGYVAAVIVFVPMAIYTYLVPLIAWLKS
jgi:hypothetical protein